MKFGLSHARKNSHSSSELVKQLTSIANKEGIGFAEAVRRTLESGDDKELCNELEAFKQQML